MPEPNSANTGKGRSFQEAAAILLSDHFGVTFFLEQAISIGLPPKPHRFDLVSNDGKYVCETKNYCWTEGGNVPSAKMGFLNEAVFYLQHISTSPFRYIVLRRDCHLKKGFPRAILREDVHAPFEWRRGAGT